MGATGNFKTRFALAVLGLVSLGTSYAAQFTTVVIDPGHGGKDGGAYWGGVAEKDLNLQVALRLEALLKAEGIPVVLTRTTDEFIELRRRAEIANGEIDAVMVSIHFNASLKKSVRGVDTFHYGSASGELAKEIQTRMVRDLKVEDRGVKRERFTVLSRTRGPAVLVECGFISNDAERARATSKEYQEKLAGSIAAGLLAWR